MEWGLLVRRSMRILYRLIERFLGLNRDSAAQPSGRAARGGLLSSALFLFVVASWMAWVSDSLNIFSITLASLGALTAILSFKKKLTLERANLFALLGHLLALFSFYIFYTRVVDVAYVTDSIVGTYMGVLKVLQFQNPYGFSIKPFLDQLGFPPSFYTPRVDGSFEFHLNYPALNFLSMVPFYLAGLHDLRDGILVFHLVSILTIFGLVPIRLKAISLAPFVFGFPLAIGYSWTDSVWAFFILLTAVLWYRSKKLSLVSFGLALATKQIAIVAAPFLLIRLWHETEGSKRTNLAKSAGYVIGAFLAPNLPFIVASPSSWWAGTVGPYLPSRTPLIPGGVGLSEILPDLGLGLSPLFFTVVAGIVAATSVAVFALRYQRLNRWVWAMPVLILFFYHRSLPNYLVYWVFPLIYERFTFGHPILTLSLSEKIIHLHWKPSSWGPLSGLRNRLGPSVILLLVLVTALVGASGAYVAQVSTPKSDVGVTRMSDPESLGVATRLDVTVTNHESEPITPTFFVKWFYLWDEWKTNETNSLNPGATRDYVVTATDPFAGVPRGNSFRVEIYDSITGKFVAQSASYSSDVVRPPVVNPRFSWWTLDTHTGRQAPFGWTLTMVNLDPTVGGINVLNQNTSSGVQLKLNSTLEPVALSELELSQRILFNETDLNILAAQPSQTILPAAVSLGAQVTDGTHILYFILSGQASQRTVSAYNALNVTVIVPFGQSSGNTASLSTQSEWHSLGWGTPGSLRFSLFIRSGRSGIFLAGIQQVVPTSHSSSKPI